MNLWAKLDCAIDAGASRVRLLVRDRGIVLDESVDELVERDQFRDRGRLLAAVLKAAFERARLRTGWLCPVRRAVLAIPYGANEVEKRVFDDALHSLGMKTVFLLESPMAAAIGAGCKVAEPKATCVVDIGARRIQAVVIALAGIVSCRSSERADAADDKRLTERVIESIRDIIEDCLDKGRFNLVDDLAEKGIVLTGGGALTAGLATAVSKALNCPVRVADKPQLAVINGVAQILPELDYLQKRR